MTFDKSKYLDQFRGEVRDHLQNITDGLLKLEKKPEDNELLKVLMREAHSIKGSATMMGFRRIADIAHRVEDGFERAMKGEISLKKVHFDEIFKCLDAIDPLLEDKVTWEAKGIDRPFVENLCTEVDEVFREGKIAGEPSLKTKKTEVFSETSKKIVLTTEDKFIHVDIDKLDNLVNLSGELLISKIRLKELVKKLSLKAGADIEYGTNENIRILIDKLSKVEENIDFSTSNMQEEVMGLRLLPVSHLFNVFPRAMRDLAQKKKKNIEFEIRGEGTQLDKSIIDQMKDPIMHLLRNSVDHGIEAPQKRKQKGKSETGKITLNAYQKGSQVLIEVSDDGKGVDLDIVRERAVSRGLVAKDRIGEMADEQVLQLLFAPGFSTKEDITETSGRGVGLDVVREKISDLKGMIEVTSSPAAGVKFLIKLPLTLAITESLLVSSCHETFAVPSDTIVETIRIKSEDIKKVETKEAITVRGHIMPLLRLNELFGYPQKGIVEKRFFSVIVVQSVEKRSGILVDKLLGRQEIISKPLGMFLKSVPNIAGATILGSGEIILILDIPSIIESAEGVIVKRRELEPAIKQAVKNKKKTILLAEDSLSTAMLEKNILESAGYSVVIARDGEEALKTAGQEKFDLIITDVLMPRMNGFELTSRLKKDKRYKDVPVIVVTTRETDADKRRGLEAGADVYMLKSEFTSEVLLDAIDRLIG